jgi:sugar phosphate isomerase/epimerase
VPPDVDALAGLEMGGIPLATMLSQETGLPTLFVRKEAKKYGTCKLAEGGEIKGRRLTIVEDVVTSGGQILLSAKELLDERGLEPVGGHFPFERYRDDVEGIAAEAKTLGLEYVGCAWIPHEGEFDEAECRNAIEVFNRAGEALSKQGLKFFYHVHGYEFRPYGDGTFLDLMMAGTKPEFVRWQMDVFWVVHPGADPVELLKRHGNRWELMHVKDMRKGVRGDLTGRSDVTNDVSVGTGQMDWPAILKAAEQAGVKWYFIEDESPTVTEQIPKSLKFLEEVKF